MEKLDKINDNEKQEIKPVREFKLYEWAPIRAGEQFNDKTGQYRHNLKNQKINLIEKIDYMDVEHSELENKVMRMLNQLQEQQKNAQTSHSEWSVLVYWSQDRIHDRLDVLEKKICQILERIPNVPDAGDNS